MKQVAASQARKDWFRLLDEVARGEVVTIPRNGHRLVLRREETEGTRPEAVPDYRGLIAAPLAEHADSWSWAWRGAGKRLVPKRSR